MNMTSEQLIKAIRKADNLEDLKRMVGPDQNEQAASDQRIQRMDKLWYKHNSDPQTLLPVKHWPSVDQEEYIHLRLQQTEFENLYC